MSDYYIFLSLLLTVTSRRGDTTRHAIRTYSVPRSLGITTVTPSVPQLPDHFALATSTSVLHVALEDGLWQGVMPGGMPEANLSQSPDLKTIPSVKPDSTHRTSHDSKISCKDCHGDYGAPAEEFLPQKSR